MSPMLMHTMAPRGTGHWRLMPRDAFCWRADDAFEEEGKEAGRATPPMLSSCCTFLPRISRLPRSKLRYAIDFSTPVHTADHSRCAATKNSQTLHSFHAYGHILCEMLRPRCIHLTMPEVRLARTDDGLISDAASFFRREKGSSPQMI